MKLHQNKIFQFIKVAALTVFNLAICAFGAAGWYLIVQNNATGDLAFAVCCLFAGMCLTGTVGLAHQVGLVK